MLKLRSSKFILALFFVAQGLFATPGTAHNWNDYKGDQDYIREDYVYNIPSTVNVLDWFELYIKTLSNDIGAHPELASQTNLLLGDAHHWLGHAHTELGQYELAFQDHLRSYEAYSQSEAQHSVYINNLLTREHARWHLTELADAMGYPLAPELRLSNESEPISDTRFGRECRARYRDNVRGLQQRNGVVFPGFCRVILTP